MFQGTHAIVSDHFICHYTANDIFLLIHAKNAKTVTIIEKDMI